MMNKHLHRQSGNVFAILFGAVALTGALSLVTLKTVTGPVKTASKVTQKNVIESTLLTNSKLVVLNTATLSNQGDIDNDGIVEPPEYILNGTGSCTISLTVGGCLPPTLGASTTDPYGNPYGYCVWDHGSEDSGQPDTGFAPPMYVINRLQGNMDNTSTLMAIISAGPDGVFQTICGAYDGSGVEGISTPADSDDVVKKYNYAEASKVAQGLWKISDTDNNVAEIEKNLEVKDSGSTVQASIDQTTGEGTFNRVSTNMITAQTDAEDYIDIDGFINFTLNDAPDNKGYIHIDQVGQYGEEIGILMQLDGDADTAPYGVVNNNVDDIMIIAETSPDGTSSNASTKFILWGDGKIYTTGPVGKGTHYPIATFHLDDPGNSHMAVTSSSNAGATLEMYTAFADTDETIGGLNPSGNNQAWQFSAHGASTSIPDYYSLRYWDGAAWNIAMSIQPTGEVHVGGYTALTEFEIEGDLHIRGDAFYFRHDGDTNTNNDFITYDDTNDLLYAGNGGMWVLHAERAQGYSDWRYPKAALSAKVGYVSQGLGIKTTTPTERVDVNGDVLATDITFTSDIRFKEAIKPLTDREDGVEAVKALKPVKYKWKDQKEHGSRDHMGFIAQDIEKIYPELVHGGDGNKSVNYTQLLPVLVKALQEQQNKIERSNKDIKALQSKLSVNAAGGDE